MILFLYLQTFREEIRDKQFKDLCEKFKDFNYKKIYLLRKCSKKIQNEDIIYYDDLYFNFNKIKKKLLQYEYIIYVDDSWIINETDYKLSKSLEILDKTIFDQVVFGEHIGQSNIIKICDTLVTIPYYENHVLDEPYIIFDKIKSIFLPKHQKNPYPKINNAPLNYDEYLMNKMAQNTCFTLRPGILKTTFLNLNKDLIKNPYLEDNYSLDLQKNNFKTCYLNEADVKKIPTSPVVRNSSGLNITLVTGYFNFGKRAKKRGVSKEYDYLESSIETLNIDHYMVIFVTADTINHVTEIRKKNNMLHKSKIIEVTEKELYQYDRIEELNKLMEKNIPPYDSKYQILAVNSRYELVGRAIKLNPFNTDYYGWIDFAISHIVDIPENFRVRYTNHDKVRLGWIARKHRKKSELIFNHKALGGGFFVGHKEILKIFINLHDNEFNKLANMGYCINDDKLLFLMYEKYPSLFDVYCSGYANLANRINDG
tara:strand:+ start:13557 stop:15005 length:1449 start_codon:yes stop_codon:yes gene_type:complete